MLKTISKAEFFFLRKIIKPYYQHIMNQPNTLLAKIFGLHKMKLYKSKTKVQKIYFLIMANLFSTPLEIDIRYDLKGSFPSKIINFALIILKFY